MSLRKDLAITAAQLTLTGHRMSAIMQNFGRRNDGLRQRHRMHEIRTEIDCHDLLVAGQAGCAHRGIGHGHEHTAMRNTIEIRVLLLHLKLQPYLTTCQRLDLNMQIFHKRIIMIEPDNLLLQFRQSVNVMQTISIRFTQLNDSLPLILFYYNTESDLKMSCYCILVYINLLY